MTPIYIVTKKRFTQTILENNRRLATDVVLGCYRSIDEARKILDRETSGFLTVIPGHEYDINDGTRFVDRFECLEKSENCVKILFKRSDTIYVWEIKYSTLH